MAIHIDSTTFENAVPVEIEIPKVRSLATLKDLLGADKVYAKAPFENVNPVEIENDGDLHTHRMHKSEFRYQTAQQIT